MQFATLFLIVSAVSAMPGSRMGKAVRSCKEYQNAGTIEEIPEECLKAVNSEFKASRRKWGCPQVNRNIKHGSKDDPAMLHVDCFPQNIPSTKELYKPASNKH